MELLIASVSRMGGGRSVIGFDGRELIRLVAPTPTGELFPQHFGLGAALPPRPYDLFRIAAPWKDSRPAQPENRVVDGTPWELLERPAASPARARFESVAPAAGALFGKGNPASIALVDCERVMFMCEWRPDRNRYAARVEFGHSGQAYNLPLTDWHWAARVLRRGEGRFAAEHLGCRGEAGLRLVISLGEPFHGIRYRMVTGILRLRGSKLCPYAPGTTSVLDEGRIAADRVVEHSRAAAGGTAI